MADGRVQELPSLWSQHVNMFITLESHCSQFSLSLHYISMIDDIDGLMIEPPSPQRPGGPAEISSLLIICSAFVVTSPILKLSQGPAGVTLSAYWKTLISQGVPRDFEFQARNWG